MNKKLFPIKITTLLLLAMLTAQAVFARPMNLREEGKDVKKLPPVNYIRSRNYDMRHIALDLKFDWEKEQAYGTAKITLAPLIPNLSTIELDAGAMTINSVKLANGSNLKFQNNEEKSALIVDLGRVYAIGEAVTFTVDYRTKGIVVSNTLGFGAGGGLKFTKPTTSNPNRRRQIWSQGETDYNRFWFPSYDSPNDFATNELTATVEKQMFVVSNGKMISNRENKDGTRTFHWKMDTPHANYLTSIVVGEYAEVKGSYQGIPVSSYVYPNEIKEGQASTGKLPRMVEFYSQKTGIKYPYVKYAQTMAEGFGGGMENITATTMTPSMILDERELLDGDSESLQSHELAHQWFGNYVTCREWAHLWLNESFATYFQALWNEHEKGKDYFLYSDVRGSQQAYLNTWNGGSRRPIVTRYYNTADDLFDTYAYPRGGAVLHMLRKHLGDEMFFKSLNRYLTKNANSPVQTQQLRIAIEETTGQSMDWFFDQWLYKMGHPIFEVSDKWENGKLTVVVKQTQKIDITNEFPQVEFFQTFVDIEIDGKVERVWIEPKAENVYTFNAASKPKMITFDNEGTLIKELKYDKSAEDLIYQLQNDDDVIGRTWAMNELKTIAANGDAKAQSAILKVVTGDQFWPLRRDAVWAAMAWKAPLPNGIKEEMLGAFETAMKDKNSNVRAAAIRGTIGQDTKRFIDSYYAAFDDKSYSVIDSAAKAVGRSKDARAFDALSKLAATEGWRDRQRMIALQALADLGDKRGLEIGIKYAGKAYPGNIREAATALAATTGAGDARVFDIVMENFTLAIDSGERRWISFALRNFALLRDPRGQQAFDQAKEKFKDDSSMTTLITKSEEQFKTALKQ